MNQVFSVLFMVTTSELDFDFFDLERNSADLIRNKWRRRHDEAHTTQEDDRFGFASDGVYLFGGSSDGTCFDRRVYVL